MNSLNNIKSLESFLECYKGGISKEEGLALSRYASEVQDGSIVEIGSYRGKSAIALAWGLEPQCNTQIYCIDPHASFVGIYGGKFGPNDRADFYKVMLDTAAYKHVALINLPSHQVARGWDEAIDFIFIDGDHSYDGVKRDVEAWKKLVKRGGILALDDATDQEIGPYKVIDEILKEKDYEHIDTVGKIVFLRRVGQLHHQRLAFRNKQMNFLIACEEVVSSGGMLRFERLGRELKKFGHTLTFLSLSNNLTPHFKSDHEIIGTEDAKARQWDFTMLPGAGFSDETIASLHKISGKSYGIKVQWVLNDTSLKERFLHANKSFSPDIVIFNNPTWKPGSYTEFSAKRFHHIYGAVDSFNFFPKARHVDGPDWIVGGLANKNPQPLIEAIRLLPEQFRLRLYGASNFDLRPHEDLISSGRLELLGKIEPEDLLAFYHSIHCVVHTELYAGWSNLVAEAMACGLPVICTEHGTNPIADENNSIILKKLNPQSIADSLLLIKQDANLCEKLSIQARQSAMQWNWSDYAKNFTSVLYDDGFSHYNFCPEHGLFGKWPLDTRISDLNFILKSKFMKGASILDLGAAEGLLAKCFKNSGAEIIHGFELDPDRVDFANLYVGDGKNIVFRKGNLGDWDKFESENGDHLLPRYDIVLYLGLHHHLPEDQRVHTLKQALKRTKSIFLIRTPETLFSHDNIDLIIHDAGFTQLKSKPSHGQYTNLGGFRIYKRMVSPSKKGKKHFVSYPKSGRTWLRFVLSRLNLLEQIHFHHDGFEFNDGSCPPHNFSFDDRMENYSVDDQIVYLDRDPRDIMVSLFHQVTGRFKDIFCYEKDISDFIRDPYFGASNLHYFQQMWEELTLSRNIISISYEECHRDLESVLRNILDFYELPYDQIELTKAVGAAKFENMKKLEDSDQFSEPWLRQRNNSNKVRKGKIGGFKNELSKRDIHYLKEIFNITE